MDDKFIKIDERTFKFSLLIIEVFKYLTTNKEFVLSKQLLRSGTSVGIIQDLKEIDSICLSLVNTDDYFDIEYYKKYKLNDGSFVYSKKEHYQIDNKNIPQRELNIRKFNNISQVISTSSDVQDEDLI